MYMNKSIKEIHESLINKEVSSKELIIESIKKSHEIQKKYNAFVTILDNASDTEVNDNLLSGIPYGVKDNYSTKNVCKAFLCGRGLATPSLESPV